MDSLINNSSTDTYYAVIINGQMLPTKYTDKYLAEKAKLDLPPEQANIADVVPITESGDQLLLG